MPLIHDDGELRRHILQGADLPVLLMTVAHTTRDLSILREEWRPVNTMGVARCNVTESEQQLIREECARYLINYHKTHDRHLTRPTYDLLRGIGDWFVGPSVEPYIPLLAEELIFDHEDPRRPKWTKQQVSPDRPFHVAIIGAGESGLITAHRLKQASIPFTIYEKNMEVGGTWLENAYPGCKVDINSFVYSYASASHVWSEFFGKRDEVLAYLRMFTKENDLYQHIEFGTEIADATWDERNHSWILTATSQAKTEQFSKDLIVFAVGQLNRPKIPEIPGVDDYGGASFHSARWDYDVDINNKTVGVIGTGASAVQFIPQVANVAKKVTVFSRTATWLLPTPELHKTTDGSVRWLMENLPGYQQWYRASLLMLQSTGLLERISVDKAYPANEQAVSAANETLRQQLVAWLEPQIVDRPDLRDAVIPNSPVGAKRILRDNGTWVRTLKRDNVVVVKQAIAEITKRGIKCTDGTEHECDVILYGTGFHASKFLFPITVTGVDGHKLQETWKNGARAYLGMTVPKFPNMFCMYGPNTNLVVHGGSIVLFSELTAKYILDAVRTLLETNEKAMDVRAEVFEEYNRRVDETNSARAWGFSKVNSWYKDENGRVSQNYPFTAAEFYQRTDSVISADYHFQDRGS